jgi:hypothetical protein
MYELEIIHRDNMDRFPKFQKFESHSPILFGVNLWLFNREGDGRTFRTTAVKSVFKPHENVFRITTKNGSIYELKKL